MTSLVPVLELAPRHYAQQERQLPPSGAAEGPQDWFQYWAESLADSGITNLHPWHPGSWLVTLDQLIAPHVLKAILTCAFKNLENWDLETLGSLDGGYILARNGAELLPQCCCDLSNLDEWENAVQHTAGEWERVWIGHPWTFVRAQGDSLIMAEPTQQDDPDQLKEAMRVPRHELLEAIAVATRQRDEFAGRLLPVVREFEPGVSERQIIDILVYGVWPH